MEQADNIWIKHVEEAIEIINSHIGDVTIEQFKNSVKDQDAVIRRIEIIGEAVSNISDKFQEAHSQVNWADIVGMRNILAHEYFGIDLDIVWSTIKNDIPRLKEALSNLKNEIV